ncbi:DUF2063 domain-containing protein [Thiomicrorhabdus hydrogeniphila]
MTTDISQANKINQIPEITETPQFQLLQQALTAHIRDPENVPYKPDFTQQDVLPIEARRLKVYQELFFNNISGFYANLFPVIHDILSEEKPQNNYQTWSELIRDFMRHHHSRTPLFHELGQEFLTYLHSDKAPLNRLPPFILELAHYEWVELALSIDEAELTPNISDIQADLTQAYQLSPLAWPVVYQWPVDKICLEFQPNTPPESPTCLLVSRSAEDRIDFMQLTPLLYHLLVSLQENNNETSAAQTLQEQLHTLATASGLTVNECETFGLQTANEFLKKQLILPL